MEEITGKNISYTLRKSARARRMSISVSCEGKVAVTIPSRLIAYNEGGIDKLIENFVLEKWEWIKKALVKFSSLPEWQKKKYTREDYLNNKEAVRILVQSRLEYFNQFYGLSWERIAIRDQKSRWGSCSKRGNLNFNYKLLWLPAELQDYIIVHELCHLRELNHSKRFWTLVAKTLPEYSLLRRKLRGGVKKGN